MDITPQQKLYPLCRTYPWERMGANPQHLKFWHSVTTRGRSSNPSGKAQLAWIRVRNMLYELADEYSKHELTPKQFKDLLVLAAQQVGWYQAPSGRKGFTAIVEGKPELRRCSKCKKEKPLPDFRTQASEKRKATYNWGRDGKATANLRTYIHALCTSCRAERKRKPKAQKGTVRGKALRKTMEVVAKLSQNFIKRMEKSRNIDDYEWVCADERYYFHKMRLAAINQARDALNKLEVSADQPVPDKWQMLLPQDVRHRLFARFEETVLPAWSGKGKQPKCF